MRKLDLIIENIRDEYMINLLEEGTASELESLKTKKFLNENLNRIRGMLVEEGAMDAVKNHLGNNWGKYLGAAGAATGAGMAADAYGMDDAFGAIANSDADLAGKAEMAGKVVGNTADMMGNDIAGAAGQAGDAIGGAAEQAGDAIGGAADDVMSKINGIANTITDPNARQAAESIINNPNLDPMKKLEVLNGLANNYSQA